MTSPPMGAPAASEYRVAILLSAHGKSPFLSRQLESIREAVRPDDVLVVVDDGSAVVDWQPMAHWPTHFVCWSRIRGLGSARSFWELLTNVPVNARYYCWADQDDIWRPDKLQRQLKALSANPRAWACVHGWRPIFHKSGEWLAGAVRSPAVQRSPAHYCFETPAPGMTLCMTETGRRLLGVQGAEQFLDALPHDRVACAILGAYGRMVLLPEALVDYRQHGSNQIGAQDAAWWQRGLKRLRRRASAWRALRAGTSLYHCLERDAPVYGHALPPLARQPLRSSAWESLLFRFLVRWLRWH